MKKGFTLAEVLITLAIIGVVAALTIPSVILNTNQQEYKTGLKKAVSVLNQAVSMNMALDNIAPSDLDSLAGKVEYFANRMNVLDSDTTNGWFKTTDGMQFTFVIPTAIPTGTETSCKDANGDAAVCTLQTALTDACTNTSPCFIIADVNGDRNPTQPATGDGATGATPQDQVPTAANAQIRDTFWLMITEDGVLPGSPSASDTMFN